MLLEGVDLPFTVGTSFIEFAILTGGKMVAKAVEAFGHANVPGPFFASFAELFMVLIVVAFAALGAPQDV